ncbi:MAG: AMP-binding protein [Bacteroidales bacterium]
MLLPEFHESFRMEGRSFTREELHAFSGRMAEDGSLPSWRRELFSFIHMFLQYGEEGILQPTSGTTGDPGKVLLKRSSMIRSAEMTLGFFQLRPGDRVLLCLPVRYIAGKMMVVRALAGGLSLVTVEPSSRPLEETSGPFRFAAMVPLQVHESLRNGDPLSELNQLIIGGGELRLSLREELKKAERPAVYETFGMTETCSHFALKRINGERPDQCFRTLEGVRIRKDGRGCLVVEVPGVTDGEIATRDLVEINPEGEGFRWLGRMDNMIKSGGVKIIPEVLEERIGKWLGRNCLVLPEEHRGLGQQLVLMVETGGRSVPGDDWLELLRSKLTGPELPKRVVTVERIPRNASFKPDRKAAIGLISRDS